MSSRVGPSPHARGAHSFTRHSAATNPRNSALSPTPTKPTNNPLPQAIPPMQEHADHHPDRKAKTEPPPRTQKTAHHHTGHRSTSKSLSPPPRSGEQFTPRSGFRRRGGHPRVRGEQLTERPAPMSSPFGRAALPVPWAVRRGHGAGVYRVVRRT